MDHRGSHRARVALALIAGLAMACGVRPSPVPGGDPAHGADLLSAFGCVACHEIPGVTGNEVALGPPLTRWAQRRTITGRIPNHPDALIRWIRDPQGVEPGTAMPTLGVTEAEARHMAAYLFTLD
jgi:cytochrome c